MKYLLYTSVLCDILSEVYSLSITFQYRDVDLFYLQPAVALAIQKLKLIKTEHGQNFSIVLVQLEDVEDKNENIKQFYKKTAMSRH